jgi:hypothetical protein
MTSTEETPKQRLLVQLLLVRFNAGFFFLGYGFLLCSSSKDSACM